MVFESVFSYMTIFFYFLIFIFLYFYVKRILINNGFNGLSMFILTFSMFYFVVPFVQTFFKLYRDDVSLFTRLLNQMSDEEVFFNLLIALICLCVVILSYNLRLNYKINRSKVQKGGRVQLLNENDVLYKKVNRITDVVFLVGLMSMVLLIFEVGSLRTYLTLGTLTRGLGKEPTDYIRPSYLQLVTLSVIILVTPYLYLYLYRLKKSKTLLIKFIAAFFFSVLFLLYNQGRAPLVIFLLPFIFLIRKESNKSKKSFLGIVVLFVVGIFSLNYLDAMFQYLAYGNYTVEKVNLVTMFLSEFSYPFANFSLRDELLNYTGYRYMYDYFVWPFTMIPSSLLGIIGINKEMLVSIISYNTEAYGFFLGVEPSGGIPVDFLTFNYYQFGYITLLPICFIVGRVLRKLDSMFYFFKDNFAIKIVIYRISFSMINLMNNAELSSIVRNRLDIVLLLIIFIYIYKQIIKQDKLQ